MPPVENARIVLFYAPRTRAFRALWFLEELGEPYRIEPVDYAGARSQAAGLFKAQSDGQAADGGG